jgi:APA family basic amino acid/polyamine antiporter
MSVPEDIQSSEGADPAVGSGLVEGLGLLDASMMVAGSMIGSGIFIVSASIARQVGSPGLLLVVWLATGLMTTMAALCYGELAAAMPIAGGEYIFLRESLGRLWGFLYGWATLLVIQTGTIAAVAIAFSSFTGVLFPWFSSSAWLSKLGTFGPYRLWFVVLGPYNVGLNTQNLLAISSIVFLTWINTRGLRTGAMVQNIFTIAKIAALGGLTLSGFCVRHAGSTELQFQRFLAEREPFWMAPLSGRPKYRVGQYSDTNWPRDGGCSVFFQRLDQCYVRCIRSEKP